MGYNGVEEVRSCKSFGAIIPVSLIIRELIF